MFGSVLDYCQVQGGENGLEAARRQLKARIVDPGLQPDRRRFLQNTLDQVQEGWFEQGCRWWYTPDAKPVAQ
jgi:hypothetical protein